jgi:hypothetical protein
MLMLTAGANEKTSGALPVSVVAATQTDKTLRPPEAEKIIIAGLIVIKPLVKFSLVFWKIVGHDEIRHSWPPFCNIEASLAYGCDRSGHTQQKSLE